MPFGPADWNREEDDLSYTLVWKTAEQITGRTVLSVHGKDFILIDFSFSASPCGVSEFLQAIILRLDASHYLLLDLAQIRALVTLVVV